MRRVAQPDELVAVRAGGGCDERIAAGPALFGDLRVSLRVLRLAPGTRPPELTAADGETMLYVIRGSGGAAAGSLELGLERESMLWLQPGETCSLTAGEAGLELLLAHAPRA